MRKAKLCEKSKKGKEACRRKAFGKKVGFTFVQGCLVSVAKKAAVISGFFLEILMLLLMLLLNLLLIFDLKNKALNIEFANQ